MEEDQGHWQKKKKSMEAHFCQFKEYMWKFGFVDKYFLAQNSLKLWVEILC